MTASQAPEVGLDTRWVAGRAPGAGTKTYIEQLVLALLRQDARMSYALWGGAIPGVEAAPNARLHPFGGRYMRAWQLAWKTVGGPRLDFIGPRPDLWHFTNYVAPPTRRPFVVTVHDLTFVLFPQFVEPRNLAFLRHHVPGTLARAAHVITDSYTTRNAVLEHFGLDPDRVTAIPLAGDPAFSAPVPACDAAAVLARYGVEGEFALTVATLEPRKNLAAAVRAFRRLGTERPRQLVIVGGRGWLADGLEDSAALQHDGVIICGYVPRSDLIVLCAAARIFVYPSLYEGFGLPVLDAMAAGVPVVCSNAGALPEVAGDAALMVDPADTESLAASMRRVFDDDELAERLAAAGRARAADFSWDETARRTLAVYELALARTNSARDRAER